MSWTVTMRADATNMAWRASDRVLVLTFFLCRGILSLRIWNMELFNSSLSVETLAATQQQKSKNKEKGFAKNAANTGDVFREHSPAAAAVKLGIRHFSAPTTDRVAL